MMEKHHVTCYISKVWTGPMDHWTFGLLLDLLRTGFLDYQHLGRGLVHFLFVGRRKLSRFSTGFNAHLERDFLMTSVGSSAEKSRVHCKIVLPGGALKFPAAVSSWISTVLSHPSYFSVQAALNDLFQLPGYTWCTLLAQLLDRFFGPKCVSKALEQVSDNQPGNNPYIIAMVVIDLL